MVRVKCPYCSKEQNTESLRAVTCFKCGKTYKIFNKVKNKSNIVKIVKGDLRLLTSEVYKQGIFKKPTQF